MIRARLLPPPKPLGATCHEAPGPISPVPLLSVSGLTYRLVDGLGRAAIPTSAPILRERTTGIRFSASPRRNHVPADTPTREQLIAPDLDQRPEAAVMATPHLVVSGGARAGRALLQAEIALGTWDAQGNLPLVVSTFPAAVSEVVATPSDVLNYPTDPVVTCVDRGQTVTLKRGPRTNHVKYSEPTKLQVWSAEAVVEAATPIPGFGPTLYFPPASTAWDGAYPVDVPPLDGVHLSVHVVMDDGGAPLPYWEQDFMFVSSGGGFGVSDNTRIDRLGTSDVYRVSATALGAVSGPFGVLRGPSWSARGFRVTGFEVYALGDRQPQGRYIKTTGTPRTVTDAAYTHATGGIVLAEPATDVRADGAPCAGSGVNWQVAPSVTTFPEAVQPAGRWSYAAGEVAIAPFPADPALEVYEHERWWPLTLDVQRTNYFGGVVQGLGGAVAAVVACPGGQGREADLSGGASLQTYALMPSNPGLVPVGIWMRGTGGVAHLFHGWGEALGDWRVDLSLLSPGEWSWVTRDHPAVQVIKEWRAADAGIAWVIEIMVVALTGIITVAIGQPCSASGRPIPTSGSPVTALDAAYTPSTGVATLAQPAEAVRSVNGTCVGSGVNWQVPAWGPKLGTRVLADGLETTPVGQAWRVPPLVTGDLTWPDAPEGCAIQHEGGLAYRMTRPEASPATLLGQDALEWTSDPRSGKSAWQACPAIQGGRLYKATLEVDVAPESLPAYGTAGVRIWLSGQFPAFGVGEWIHLGQQRFRLQVSGLSVATPTGKVGIVRASTAIALRFSRWLLEDQETGEVVFYCHIPGGSEGPDFTWSGSVVTLAQDADVEAVWP
jgi:hypothetical protein